LQAVLVTGRNRQMEGRVRRQCQRSPRFRVLGWVNNMHEWLAAADLLVSKPGGMTVAEAINSGVPLLALDPLPGAERRACDLVEKWQVGYWIKRAAGLAPVIERLLDNPQEIERLRASARTLARPHAAREAAEAILKGWQSRH
jgi:processive 1,2-diacylglycerol beta-glucosyltransferase